LNDTIASEISYEASVRESADASLDTVIANEISLVEGKLSVETSNRESADTSLDSKIDSEVSTLEGSISSETSSRVSADASLAAEISAINASDFGKVGTTGSVDGTNKEFPLSSVLVVNTEFVYLNGLLQKAGDDYTLVTNIAANPNTVRIDFVTAPKLGSSVQFAGNVVA
jgi:hypothetical protein